MSQLNLNQKLKQKVLIFQHAEEDPAGSTLEWLKGNSIEFQVVRADLLDSNSSTLPKHDSYDWLIVLGGAPNVDQENQFPWLKPEKKFIKEAIDLNKKVLGLCLGGQLLAELLGGKVQRHSHWEVGWHDVNIDRSLPHFGSSPEKLSVFQFHGYRFWTPPNCKKIAGNEICSDQGFMFGERIVGFQFHPESTVEWVSQLATETLKSIQPGPFVQTEQEILENMHLQEKMKAWYFEFLNSFKNV